MENFKLLAEPFWVNFLILVPLVAYFFWRKEKLSVSKKVLVAVLLFGAAFGFVEAAVVVYLRTALVLLPHYSGFLSGTAQFSSDIAEQVKVLSESPLNLFLIEIFREAATIIMLGALAYLAVKNLRERFAVFLLAFAVWDIVYYLGLWLSVGWPQSIFDLDVLFLIPVPWTSQVWFPILVSTLSIIAVFLVNEPKLPVSGGDEVQKEPKFE